MFHTEIADRWNTFTIFEQMAHVGAEVGRIFSWKKKGNVQMWRNALYRAIELLDVTIKDEKNVVRLKELLRVKEVLCDSVIGENIYNVSADEWNTYFTSFNLAARK